MKEVAKFYIDNKFIITGRGLVFTGNIIKGLVSIGDYIEFKFNNEIIKRKIKGISSMSNPLNSEGVFEKNNVGILIESKNEEEIKRIRESELKNVEVLVFEI